MIPLLYQLSYTATGEFDRLLKYSITAFLSRKTVAAPFVSRGPQAIP
jgi:hypothetical protein